MIEKKVALYARVSTGNQGTGLESQIRALRDYCTRRNITNYVIYEDENQSGIKQSRPSLDRMMDDARAGIIETVVVYSFSRYARSVTHLLRALEEFKALKTGFISITENIDTSSPLGSAVFTILGAVSQLERDILAERVRNGLSNARAKGVHLGRKKLRPSEMIRTLRASKMTYREISRVLKISSGAVAAEVRQQKLEEAKKKQELKDVLILSGAGTQSEQPIEVVDAEHGFHEITVEKADDQKIELEISK